MKRAVLAVLAVLFLEAVLSLAIRAGGLVDVSAAGAPGALETWFLGGTADHAIARLAQPIPAIDGSDADALSEGLEHYNEMCVGCHAAPGRDDSEVARGLNPPAPHLWEQDTQDMSDAELFWVIKNGIRMTGMPAFGTTHPDEKIRDIVAMVRKLPDLKGDQYSQMVEAAGLGAPGGDDADDDAPGHGEGEE